MKDITAGDDCTPALNTDDVTEPGTTDYSETVFGHALGYAISSAFGIVPQNRGDGWRATRGARKGHA